MKQPCFYCGTLTTASIESNGHRPCCHDCWRERNNLPAFDPEWDKQQARREADIYGWNPL